MKQITINVPKNFDSSKIHENEYIDYKRSINLMNE